MYPALNHWYHATLSAYGQWLPGDLRGWRERHHRRHVAGDYQHPLPPTTRNANLHEHSKAVLRHDPVTFLPWQRPLIGQMVLDTFAFYKLSAFVLSSGGAHIHMLAQIPDANPKVRIGRVKSWVWDQANKRGCLTPPQMHGELWAEGSHPKPIRDRDHFVETVQYILDHEKEGAWVWKSPAPLPV